MKQITLCLGQIELNLSFKQIRVKKQSENSVALDNNQRQLKFNLKKLNILRIFDAIQSIINSWLYRTIQACPMTSNIKNI